MIEPSGSTHPRLLMETTALTRPGRERGLGRYVRACLAGARKLDYEVKELRVRKRSGRSAEFLDMAERSGRAYCSRYDLFHVTHPRVWGLSRAPTVVSILDLIPIDVGGYQKTGLKSRFFLSRAAGAQVILTISEFSAQRIAEYFAVDAERIVVAPLFPVEAFQLGRDSAPREDLPPKYALSIVDMASPDPRKRPGWIAPLAQQLKRAGIALVVAGGGTDEQAAHLGSAIGIGRVSDAQLAQLARHSVCFLYFSAYEGQGLPPLEAMTAGAAIVSTANTAITEVVGPGGLLVEERSKSWTHALLDGSQAEATRTDLVEACAAIDRDESFREDLRSRSLAQASLFSEDRFFDGLAHAYRMATCV